MGNFIIISIGKNKVPVGFSTIQGFRNPLELMGKGEPTLHKFPLLLPFKVNYTLKATHFIHSIYNELLIRYVRKSAKYYVCGYQKTPQKSYF